MNLRLARNVFTEKSTIGELYVNEAWECFTLEDVVREVKIPKQTAIPAGIYGVVLNWSDRFKRIMPLLLNVPGFDGIRIHAGNTDADTAGCILVGQQKWQDFISESKLAYTALFFKLELWNRMEKIKIEINEKR